MKDIRRIIGVILLISIFFTLTLNGCTYEADTGNDKHKIVGESNNTPIVEPRIETDILNEEELNKEDPDQALNDETEDEDEKDISQKGDSLPEESAGIQKNEETDNEETNAEITGQLKVHFIDVGQGDSILIQQGENAMLIDAGDRGYGSTVEGYLNKQGVKKLDYIVFTHPHADHIGGGADVLNAFGVDKIIMPKVSNNTKTFESLLETIQEKNKKITTPSPGDQYDLGTSNFKILGPTSSNNKNLNNASVVIQLSFGATSFLFTGDAESASEKGILNRGYDLGSDVLKVGHHGSDTSTSDSFLKAVSPSYSVISWGKGNKYSHPNQSVTDRLANQKIQIFRTDESGTIVATSDGTVVTFDKKASQVKENAPPGKKATTKSKQESKPKEKTKSKEETKPEDKSKPKETTKPKPKPETDNKKEVYITNTGKSIMHRAVDT